MKTYYDILIDKDFSPVAMSQTLISGNYGFISLFGDNKDLTTPLKVLKGVGELSLSFLTSNVTLLLQHEVFGHGYRIRDIGSKHVELADPAYSFDFLGGTGMTSFWRYPSLTVGQKLSIDIAGLEGEEILARDLKMKWLENQNVDARTALLYIRTRLATNLYAWLGSEESSDDINNYLKGLNILYPTYPMSRSTLNRKLLWNLADPFLLYSILSIGKYLIEGKSLTPPLINFKVLRWLPNLKVELAPYGLEYYLENYFIQNKKAFYIYAKMGVCRSQATRKMVEGPPNSATRGRIQTTSGGFC